MIVYDLVLPLLVSFLVLICVLVSVAFFTLFERKILGYIQIRKGPNKVGFIGILQPFSDAIKLFTKEQVVLRYSNFLLYYFSPIFSLFLSLFIWISIPYLIKLYSFNLGILFVLSCLSLGVYGVMVAGWSSNSNYALLGGLRSVAQTISYEVSLVFILLSFLFLSGSFSLFSFYYKQSYCWLLLFFLPLSFVWFVSMLAETNRTPFDFAEGESELVSGFNIEYGAGGFALIFLAEYSSIIFMSCIFCVMFLGGDMFSLSFYLNIVFMCFLFIWVRGAYPRFRYDKLMGLAWKKFLPISLFYIIFFLGFKLCMFSILL